MLVVAPTQDVARAYVKYLNKKGVPALLAISDDSEQAYRSPSGGTRENAEHDCGTEVGRRG